MSFEPTTLDEPLALRPREAAKRLSISERSLWQWTKDGSIPHVRCGRAILYPVQELRQWLTDRATAETRSA